MSELVIGVIVLVCAITIKVVEDWVESNRRVNLIDVPIVSNRERREIFDKIDSLVYGRDFRDAIEYIRNTPFSINYIRKCYETKVLLLERELFSSESCIKPIVPGLTGEFRIIEKEVLTGRYNDLVIKIDSIRIFIEVLKSREEYGVTEG